jgi:hypothetical protein
VRALYEQTGPDGRVGEVRLTGSQDSR